MTDRQQRIQVLYEISLAIEPAETVTATATNALQAYLQKLNCSVGGVFAHRSDEVYELVVSRPAAAASDELYAAAESRLSEWTATSPETRESLPIVESVGSNSYYLFELPEFGVLLLGDRDREFDQLVVTSLQPLNEKLATACTAKQVEAELREERQRLEAMVTTIQEPIVNISVPDTGDPTIKWGNRPFEDTFGETVSTAGGEKRIEPAVPADDSDSDTAATIQSRLANGQPVTEEVRRQTATGVGNFLLRAVPVATDEGQEFFCLYVDITAEKHQQRMLESLYYESKAVLTSNDRQTACDRTVSTAASVISGSVAEVHLYDRATDAIQPTATTASEPVFAADNDTDDRTPLWEAYSGTTRCIDALSEADEPVEYSGMDIESVLLLPLSDHGVLVIGDDQRNAFDTTDFNLGRLLTTLASISLTRAQRTQSLEAVQEITQDTVTADTRSTVLDLVFDQLPRALNFPITGIWEQNSTKQQLEPVGMTDPAFDMFSEPPVFQRGDGIAWDVFESGETKLVSDVDSHPDAYNEDSKIQSEIITPIGEFGLLMAGTVRSQQLTEVDRKIADTLASNLETSLQLVDSRQELRLLEEVMDRVLRHNLRNDLSVIKGSASILVEEYPESEHPEMIIERCESLERTATNARAMRKVVQTRDTRHTIDIDTVVENAVESAPELTADVELTVDTASTETVIAHPELSEAVAQLIENSLEYGVDAGGEISVKSKTDGSDVAIEVVDDGPGIPPNEIEVIEQHGESALEHGSGVGLWLVDRIVEYSGGVLSFETSSGTTAKITLQTA